MSDSYLERVAGELADMALADEARTADDKIINIIAEVLGSSSQTLQEAYLTAVRVRRAETRAREILIERGAEVLVSKERRLTDEDGPSKASKRNTTDFEQPREKPVEKPQEKAKPFEAKQESAPAPHKDNEPRESNSDEDTLDDVMDMLGNAFAAKKD